jgi:hypothetical protein
MKIWEWAKLTKTFFLAFLPHLLLKISYNFFVLRSAVKFKEKK